MEELQVGGRFAGYRIDGIAGRGGMGVVYRATDVRLERAVALKVIAPQLADDPDFRRRFESEARLAASLDHPNIVPIYHADTEDGALYVTMRYVEGTDLREMIAAQGAIDPRVATRISAQIGDALDAAHARGLVHRDVKPANVLLAGSTEQVHAYLSDFGLTKVASSESGMTATGMIVGTIDYMAPEQVQDGARVDARSDTYALAALLYHALTGDVPFPRPTDAAKIFAHGMDPVPDPREKRAELPDELSGVVMRGMAKDPEDRYLSAGDLGRAAVAAAEGKRLTRAERNVATGEAAPLGAAAVPPREPPPAEPTKLSDRGGDAAGDGAVEAPDLAGAPGAGAASAASPGGAVSAAGGDAAASSASEGGAVSPAPPPGRSAGGGRPPLAWIGVTVATIAAVVGVLAALGVFSGDETPAAPEIEALTSARLAVEPSGTDATFDVVEEPGGEIVVIMSEEAGGTMSEVARVAAPRARASSAHKDSGAIQLEVGQEGRSYSPNGGEGLLTIGDDYAQYFGWSLRTRSIEFY